MTIKEIRAATRKKILGIQESEKNVLGRSKTLQKKLSNYLAGTFLPSFDVDDNGLIKNTTTNLRKIANPSKLRAFFKKEVSRPLIAMYNASFLGISGNSVGAYNGFGLKEATQEAIFNRASISQESFLLELFDNNDVIKALQANIRNGIKIKQPYADLSGLIKEQVDGKEDKFGILENYHYRNGVEEFQTYSRTLDQEFSEALKLNYAIYSGTEIKTTRHFCDERVGKVFNRETILSWNDEEWSGKKEGHQILVDLGGWNCRHDLAWITYELAKRLDKGIEKSKFDK